MRRHHSDDSAIIRWNVSSGAKKSPANASSYVTGGVCRERFLSSEQAASDTRMLIRVSDANALGGKKIRGKPVN